MTRVVTFIFGLGVPIGGRSVGSWLDQAAATTPRPDGPLSRRPIGVAPVASKDLLPPDQRRICRPGTLATGDQTAVGGPWRWDRKEAGTWQV